MEYLTKDENGTWIKWKSEPKIIYPLDRTEDCYWEAKGEFERIDDPVELPSKCLIYIEILD